MTKFATKVNQESAAHIEIYVEAGYVSFFVHASFGKGSVDVIIEYLCNESNEALQLGVEYITGPFIDICELRNIYDVELTDYTFKQLVLQ